MYQESLKLNCGLFFCLQGPFYGTSFKIRKNVFMCTWTPTETCSEIYEGWIQVIEEEERQEQANKNKTKTKTPENQNMVKNEK